MPLSPPCSKPSSIDSANCRPIVSWISGNPSQLTQDIHPAFGAFGAGTFALTSPRKHFTRQVHPAIVDQLYDDVPTLKSISVCLNSLRVVSPGNRRCHTTRKGPLDPDRKSCPYKTPSPSRSGQRVNTMVLCSEVLVRSMPVTPGGRGVTSA